ncbi:MAG: B-box zinc finger protein [Acidobacteriaceae bacterium]
MTEATPKMYCANHPNIETNLRCNKCEKPICAKCAILTPTGYRCRECVRGQQKVFETAVWLDYPLLFVVVLILAFLGSLIAFRLGFFTILLAPIAGGVIAEIARAVTRRRRSKRLYLLAGLAAVAGCIPIGLQFIINFSLLGLVWHGIYTVLMTSALYTRLAGIRIG